MRIFTIGYEGITQAEFIAALQSAGVERVIDIRAVPNSRLAQFNDAIEQGKILMMADVPDHRVNEVREVLASRHPEAEERGIDPHIPAFP